MTTTKIGPKEQRKRKSTPEALVLVRANNGDWSLHPPAGATKEGEELVTLVSGTARKVGELWDHPDKRDCDLAWQMWAHHLSRSMRPMRPRGGKIR